MLRQRGDRIETGRLGLARRHGRAAALLPAERLGLGRDRWLDTSTFRARWLIARRALQKHAVQPRPHEARRPAARRPGQARRPRARLVGLARRLPADPRSAHARLRRPRRWRPRSPTTTGRRRSPSWPTTGSATSRPCRRRCRPHDDDCHHCNEFSRVDAAPPRRSPRPGSGLPAIEPGMPVPAGTGLDRRTFLSRTLGAALTVYGASALGPRAFDEAIARAAGTGRGDKTRARHDLRPGRLGFAVAPLSERRPAVPPAAAGARAEARRGPVLRERLAPPLASVARAVREAARAREG